MRLPSKRTNFYHLSHYFNALDIEVVNAVVVYAQNHKPVNTLEGVTYISESETEGEAFELLKRVLAGKHFKKSVVSFKHRNRGLSKDERNKKGGYKVAAHIYLSYDDAKKISRKQRVTERVRSHVRVFLFGIGKASYSALEGTDGLIQAQIKNKEYQEKENLRNAEKEKAAVDKM